MKTIVKISDEKKNTCENCKKFTTGHVYGGGGLNYFSVTKQYEIELFFCSEKCAEEKTGRMAI